MSRNVEIKAQVSDMASLKERAKSIATEGPFEINQEDTFFKCNSGRLKLRKFDDARGELIFYRRSDQGGPKESFYLRSKTSDPDTLRQSLDIAYGMTGQVKKARSLYMVGRTRVHLDKVEELGDFMELEVVLTNDDSTEYGVAEAERLMEQLGVASDDLVEGAYIDLLQRQDA